MRNKIIYLSSVVLLCALWGACKEDAIEKWQGQDYIQFLPDNPSFYSFVYAGSSVMQDTIPIKLRIAGNVLPHDRHYKLIRVKSYGFVYEKDQFGHVIDSAFIELPNQGQPGIHFKGWDKDSTFLIPADSVGTVFNLIIMRDSSLQENDYTITLEIAASDDFLPGSAPRRRVSITLSDKVEEPTLWDEPILDGRSVFSVMGYYGKKKHQILIDATGKPWNNQFIQYELDEEYLVFYRDVAERELNKINAERAAQGLHELREDDANPNSAVKFRL